MQLPISRTDIDRFTPPGSTAVYLLATPTLMQRAAFKRDLVSLGATMHDRPALLAALRADLRAAAPYNLDQLIEVLDGYEAAPDEADSATKAEVDGMMRLARAYAGEYAQRLGDNAHFNDVLPIVACKHFLVGWEGVTDADGKPAPFARVNNQTTDATLMAIPAAELVAVGMRAFLRMVVPDGIKKNSASPSPSTVTRRLSPPKKKPRRTARRGSSSAKSTGATPASS